MAMKLRPFHSSIALAALLLASWGAHAQAFRAYLASYGVNNATCTLQAPCRLLPDALAAVADGGEIWMLDSANYNSAPVNITKSVTILAVPGALGSVVATNGNAINIATANVKVVLRNLVIVPLPGMGGANGIYMTAGAQLTVEKSSISNLPASGILVVGPFKVRVTDTVVRDNGDVGIWLLRGARAAITRSTVSGNASSGVFVIGDLDGTLTVADIATSTLDGNTNGVSVWSETSGATVKVAIHDSRLVGNTNAGAEALSTFLAGGPISLSVSRNIVSHNAVGVQASNPGTKVFASANTVSANTTGFSNNSALFESAGNNAMRNNGTDSSGTIGAGGTM
jgi:hypothetical protein